MNETIGTLGMGLLINFLYQVLSENVSNTLEPSFEEQVKEALQGAFDRVSDEYGVVEEADSLTFWDRVSENLFTKMSSEKHEQLAVSRNVESYIKEQIPENTNYDINDICNKFWISFYMEIAKFNDLYRYYMLSTNKQQIDMLVGIKQSVDEIAEDKVKRIEHSAGNLYNELYLHTEQFAEIMHIYAELNTSLRRTSFDEEQNYRGNSYTQFSYLREVSESWSRDISITKKELRRLAVPEGQLRDFFSRANKCYNNAKNKEIRALVVNIPRFIFTKEFNEIYDKLDYVWQQYASVANIDGASDMESTRNELVKCFEIAHGLEAKVKSLSMKDIISKEWIETLEKIESVSIGESYA